MSRIPLETAILRLARDQGLLASFRADPQGVGKQLDLTAEWADVIARGDRDQLRSAGVSDGITILVSRWFRDDLGDAGSTGKLQVDITTPLPTADVPKDLVFAGGCSHVPDLLVRPEIDPRESVQRLLQGYDRLSRVIAEARLDVLLLTYDCHFQTFETGAIVVGTADWHSGSMAFFKRPDIEISVRGDALFAAGIVAAVRKYGLEVEAAPKVDLDHGVIVPVQLLRLSPNIAVIPIVTQPARTFSPFGARAFGEALKQVLQHSGKRVGILATGGLSHWLDPGKFGFVDVEFDSHVLAMLQAGRGWDLSLLQPYPLLDHGQYEFLNWLIMLGALGPGVRGDVYAYEPLQASGGGWTVVNMLLADSKNDLERDDRNAT